MVSEEQRTLPADPLVSVVIPTFNSGHLLSEAIDSVLAQTYRHYEIIVVDDGSTDETSQVAAGYRDKVHCYRQQNKGSSAARQAGIDLSHGKYIAALDADDLWLPTKLEHQINALESHQGAGLCYCDGYLWKEGTDLLESPLLSGLYGKGITGWQFDRLFKVGAVATSSMVFPSSAIRHVGGYNPRLRWGDFEICARVCAFFPAVFVDRPLMAYRVHGGNSSSLVTSQNVMQRLRIKRMARASVLESVPENAGDLSIRVYRHLPEGLQYAMLLWWRVAYGSSFRHSLRGLGRYGMRMIQRLLEGWDPATAHQKGAHR